MNLVQARKKTIYLVLKNKIVLFLFILYHKLLLQSSHIGYKNEIINIFEMI